ncbi:unnamed protein product, partial [Iphiclides podalirius]
MNVSPRNYNAHSKTRACNGTRGDRTTSRGERGEYMPHSGGNIKHVHYFGANWVRFAAGVERRVAARPGQYPVCAPRNGLITPDTIRIHNAFALS